MQEYERKHNLKFTDKERMLVLGSAADNFEKLEREKFSLENENDQDTVNDETRKLVMRILPSIERIKESKSTACPIKEADNIEDYNSNMIKISNKLHSNGSKILDPLCENSNSVSSAFEWYSTHSKTSPSETANDIKLQLNKASAETKQTTSLKQYYFTSRNFFQKRNDSNSNSSNATNEKYKKEQQKVGLYKIAEDDGINEYDDSDDESKEHSKIQPNKNKNDKRSKNVEDYSSSRERVSGNIRIANTKGDSLVKSNVNSRIKGKDIQFSYNTQYGGGFGNFNNSKISQYSQWANQITEINQNTKKKQTSSSLQRIEQSNRFDNLSGFGKNNKIDATFSLHDASNHDMSFIKK